MSAKSTPTCQHRDTNARFTAPTLCSVGTTACHLCVNSAANSSAACCRALWEATSPAVSPTTLCTTTTATADSPATAATTSSHSNVVNPPSPRRR